MLSAAGFLPERGGAAPAVAVAAVFAGPAEVLSPVGFVGASISIDNDMIGRIFG